jgi:hypothetical protein
MNIAVKPPVRQKLSFIEMCRMASQASRMSQAIPYFGRAPAKSLDNFRKMARDL